MGLGRDILYATAALAVSPLWVSSLLRTGKWRTDWLGRFGQVNANLVNARRPRPLPSVHEPQSDRPTLLIHGVSVGEVNAARPLVEALENQHPHWHLVIATTTDTGQQRARDLFADKHSVVRYPLDFSFCVKRFLDVVQPDAVALMELEVWPNFVSACEARNIAVCVVSGRLSARSFARYRWLRRAIRPTFQSLAAVGAQTDADAERFKALGAPAKRTHVLDTMKWDTAAIADDVEGADELASAMGIDSSRPLVVAGSTGPGEEQTLIDQCPAEAQLLLVPRKPERFEQVAQLDPNIVRRTQPRAAQADAHDDRPRVFLLDTMGELDKAYALADVAIVGRSFNGQGGSAPIQPIALGKPTIIGPDHANFAGVVHAFEQGGGIVVTKRLHETIKHWLADRDHAQQIASHGRAVIRSRQGATNRYMQMIEQVLASTEQCAQARVD
jgi:3-deoxy-D-manno-octulosonic-acid transferase